MTRLEMRTQAHKLFLQYLDRFAFLAPVPEQRLTFRLRSCAEIGQELGITITPANLLAWLKRDRPQLALLYQRRTTGSQPWRRKTPDKIGAKI